MNITISDQFLQIAEVDGRNEMTNRLIMCPDGYEVFGENCVHERVSYVIKLYSQNSVNSCFGLGIISESHGLKPHLMTNHAENIIFLGFNQEVVVFDCVEKKVLQRLETDSLFYSFVNLTEFKSILIVHELGIIMTTMRGEKVWDFTCDIISGIGVEGSFIKLTLQDGDAICVSLKDGELVK